MLQNSLILLYQKKKKKKEKSTYKEILDMKLSFSADNTLYLFSHQKEKNCSKENVK